MSDAQNTKSTELAACLAKAFEDDAYYHVPSAITRYDYDTTHGWWLRINRNGEPYQELFYDSVHNGPEDALKIAILRRHEVIEAFPVNLKKVNGRALPDDPKKRIDRIEVPGKMNTYIAWKARFYNEEGKARHKSFSVRKFGEEEARLLALNFAKKHSDRKRLLPVVDHHKKTKFKKILREDVQVLATINSKRKRGGASDNSSKIEPNPHGFEGDRRWVIHQQIERDPKLRAAKIDAFMTKHGTIFCEVCKFNFLETYGFLELNIIEVHHVIPLSTLKQGTERTITDLMLLCSNCHFAIHQGDAERNLEAMRSQFDSNISSGQKRG